MPYTSTSQLEGKRLSPSPNANPNANPSPSPSRSPNPNPNPNWKVEILHGVQGDFANGNMRSTRAEA